MNYLLRIKQSGRSSTDVLVVTESLPRIGDEIELYEFGGVEAVRGRGLLGDDPAATFWVEAVHRPMRVRDGYANQMEEGEPMVIASNAPFRIGEKTIYSPLVGDTT